MKKLMKIFKLICILSMLGACGEAYRGRIETTSSTANTGTEFFGRNGERVSQTEANVDHQVFMTYIQDMIDDENDIEELHESIEAFDLIVTGRDDGSIQLNARLAFGCNNGILFSGVTTRALLPATANRNPISFGIINGYSVEIQCTTRSCAEMVAAIRKVEDPDAAVILAPLGVFSGGNGRVLYGIRDLNLLPYFAEFNHDHVEAFESENSCTAVDGANGGTTTSDDDRGLLGEVGNLVDRFVDRDELVSRGLGVLRDFVGL